MPALPRVSRHNLAATFPRRRLRRRRLARVGAVTAWTTRRVTPPHVSPSPGWIEAAAPDSVHVSWPAALSGRSERATLRASLPIRARHRGTPSRGSVAPVPRPRGARRADRPRSGAGRERCCSRPRRPGLYLPAPTFETEVVLRVSGIHRSRAGAPALPQPDQRLGGRHLRVPAARGRGGRHAADDDRRARRRGRGPGASGSQADVRGGQARGPQGLAGRAGASERLHHFGGQSRARARTSTSRSSIRKSCATTKGASSCVSVGGGAALRPGLGPSGRRDGLRSPVGRPNTDRRRGRLAHHPAGGGRLAGAEPGAPARRARSGFAARAP